MNKRRVQKWKYILPCVLILLIVSGLALWQPVPEDDVVEVHQVYGIVQNSLATEDEIILSNEEVNILLREFGADNKKIGDIIVKGVEIDIEDENLVIYSPMSYKGISFLLSTTGKISYREPFIEYQIKKVHMGKLPLPKGILLYILNKTDSKLVILEKDTIKFDKEIIPLPIHSLSLREEKIVVGIDEEEKIEWLLRFPKDEIEKKGKEVLEKVVDGLDKVKDILSQEEQKNMIEDMQESIREWLEDPNDQSKVDLGEIRSLYNTLTVQEKYEVLSTLTSEFDREELLLLQEELF